MRPFKFHRGCKHRTPIPGKRRAKCYGEAINDTDYCRSHQWRIKVRYDRIAQVWIIEDEGGIVDIVVSGNLAGTIAHRHLAALREGHRHVPEQKLIWQT